MINCGAGFEIPEYQGKYIGQTMVVKEQEVVALLSRMISIPSVVGNESELGRFLIKCCEEAGLVVEIQPVAPERFNVLVTLGASSYKAAKLGLLYHGHYDTVPALDLKNPFSAELKDGFMWGRGTVDQKGGLAAAIMSLVAIKRSGKRLKKPVTVAAVVDEESEHRGSYELVKSGLETDFAVVTEPSKMSGVLGCKGTVPVKITVKGLTAHACRPWLGVNAVQKALPILELLFAKNFAETDLGPTLGKIKGTLSVGIVEAGTAYNNVPGECVIWLDRRTIPGETTEQVLHEIEDVINKATQIDPELQAHAKIARPDWNWNPIIERGLRPTLTGEHNPLVKIVDGVHYEVTGKLMEKYVTDGYNELDFLVNDLNIPAIQYGPGDPDLCHTAREQLNIKELFETTEVYCRLIEKICVTTII
ncbi:MAG: M20/M25/M40 family metallo-hydrolase [Dethiobacter sp.]|jgi:acetylornithine deacetylase/succinyl-diaminopimelate desuccinylase|nr:M20/M25/M40 family metallo-hydrolase [Dethiobacter sp.]